MVEVPAYLVTDEAPSDLEQWKAEHPDWFVAGIWTPSEQPRHLGGSRFDPIPSDRLRGLIGTGRMGSLSDSVDAARPIALPDPSTMSVRDFMNTRADIGGDHGATPSEAAGVPLSIQDANAPLWSQFSDRVEKDSNYTHVPTRNVKNMIEGYRIFQERDIGSAQRR